MAVRLSFAKCLAFAAPVALVVGWLCLLPWSDADAAGPALAPTPTNAGGPVPSFHAGFSGVSLHGPTQWPYAGSGPTTPFGQGTYVEPGRIQHVPEYRLRVDDVVELVYRRTHEETGLYRLSVGDKIRVELPPGTNGAETVNREVVVQPDGDITLPYLGPVRAAKLTFAELAKTLAQEYERIGYKKHIAKPTITPVLIDAKLADLINTVDSRYGAGGQVRVSRVAPDGAIALPAVGSVSVVGLTLDELKAELSGRYQQAGVGGIEVQPVLQQRAPRHVFVLGEVRSPGRHTLEGPTTVMQAISLAGGVTSAAGANLQQVVIFRRTHDWGMIATMVDLHDPIIKGAGPCSTVCDLWVADADLIIVPKTRILVFDEFVELVFTRGIYGVIPLQGVSIGFSKNSSL
jgi:polysaccharide export outer membrane protein